MTPICGREETGMKRIFCTLVTIAALLGAIYPNPHYWF